MKKSLFFLLALLITGSGFAQKAPLTKLLSSSEDKVTVNVKLNGYSTTKVQTPQGEQFIVNVPEMAAMLEAGTPDLPTLPIPVLIGDCAEMTVNVIDAQYTDYANMDIAPSKGNISRQINPDDVPYTYGEMYQQDAFYPATQAYLEAPYILRDFRGQNIMVQPFAYNPKSHTLRVYESLTIEMKKVSDNGMNQKVGRRSNTIKMDPETNHAYSQRFINFGQSTAKYTFVEDAGEMLVIYADQYANAIQPLVDWKNESGRPTMKASVSEVGGNNDNAIKNYITNIYNDPNHNLQFVLFVGEYDQITPHALSGERSDNWFGQLEGNDHYPEVFVGRFSAQNETQVNTQVNKVLYYERDLTEGNWCNKGLGIGAIGAGSGHYGEDDYQHIDLIRDTLLHYTYVTVTDLHQGGGASATSISNTINQGISIINYCNHGSPTSWGVANYSTSNVNALTNDYMLPLVWSVACENGQFSVGECFAESWLRATDNSNGAPTGAIGGMFSWMSQPWIPPMYGQDEMVDILTEWRNTDQFHHTMAGASLNGNMNVIDMTGSSGYATHDTWMLFGDPSLMLRTDVPTSLNVTATPSVLLIGMNELNINADAAYGIATLSMNGEVLSSAYIQNGSATLSFPALSNVGVATLTVMGYNKLTTRMEVEIVPAEGPYLVLNGYQVNTEDGQYTYGEEGTINISVKNVGVENINDVTVTLSTESEYIAEMINGTATIPSLGADETIEINDVFRFAIADDVPDGAEINFNLSYVSGEYSWTSEIKVYVKAPNLELGTVTLEGEIVGGGQGTMKIELVNNGHADAPAGSFNLFSSSTDITLAESVMELPSIPANGSITLEFPFAIAENVQEGSCYEIVYLLTADHYTITGSTAISIGNVLDDFETGDFSKFNWTFSGSANWVIDSSNANSGSFCAKSGTITHSSNTSLELTLNVPMDGEISFYKKVSSESGYDKLSFYIDGQEKGNWSGNVNWSQESYPITTGTHTLRWTYSKDTSVSNGQDCAWIDDVQFPATSMVSALPPVLGLEAEVYENDVILRWIPIDRAISYTIIRNGEVLGTQAEVDFQDTVEHGLYTYSVIANNEEGQLSTPAFVTVNVTSFLGISENNRSFRVYPNPTDGRLNIQMAGDYTYTLFNSFGQQVMNGQAHGEQQLNISGLAKGIYLLHLNNGTTTNIEKVIVK